MKFINLQATYHDEKLKERMREGYFKDKNITKDIVKSDERTLRVMINHFKKQLNWIKSPSYVERLLEKYEDFRIPTSFSRLDYGYLGDKDQLQNWFPYSEVAFDVQIIVSQKFEQNGYRWFSDGTYAFSHEMDAECYVRIIKLLIEDLEREISVNKETIELVDSSSMNSHLIHDGDTEPTGL